MAQDRDDRRYGDEPLWDESRRRERERRDMGGPQNDRYSEDRYSNDRYSEDRARRANDHDDTRYRPFGDTGPISTRSGAYSGDGRRAGPSGRYEDLSPGYRDFEANQRRAPRGDYDPARYTPNPREGRGEEARSWWERTQDELSAWFGDENARRRREWDEHQSEVRAEHRGRGPKGYKRTDARIEEDLNERLTEDSYLDASDIQVSVQGGEVTLSGLVARREDKRRAEDLAERITGVGHVQNNLRVRPRADATASDITL